MANVFSFTQRNLTNTTPAPSVRYIRSPWSLRSGGLGFKSEHTNGSAVGAVIRNPAKRSARYYPQSILLNRIQAICSDFMTEIEFEIQLCRTYGASLQCGTSIPHGNALHSHGATDMPPQKGAGLYPSIVECHSFD